MQKSSIILLAALVICSIMLVNFQKNTGQTIQNLLFSKWKQQFSKKYQNSLEQKYRYQLFTENYQIITQNNRKYETGNELMKMSLNQFSDLTVEQFTDLYLNQNAIPNTNFTCTGPPAPYQTKFDANFTINPDTISRVVIMQGQCSSGYAIATIGAVQNIMYDQWILVPSISIQQVIDCSQQSGNSGCQGGNSLNTLDYLVKRGAMRTLDYPYTGVLGSCTYNVQKKYWRISNCAKVISQINMLKSAIFQQPVVVGFDAKDVKFIMYGSGLYIAPSSCGTGSLNHYMLATGWGQVTIKSPLKNTTYQYLVVKNSLGKAWGNLGYGNIVYQSIQDAHIQPNNACGIMKQLYFPNL